jgi:translation initiation factor 1
MQQQGRRKITIIQGLPEAINMNRVLRFLKKTLNCNGSIKNDDEFGNCVQLTGDQREGTKQFLIDYLQYDAANIRLHGAS